MLFEGKRVLWLILLGLHVAALPVVAVVAMSLLPVGQRPPVVGVVLVAIAALVALVVIVRGRSIVTGACVAAAVAPIFFSVMAAHASLWDAERSNLRAFDEQVLTHVAPGDTLLGWGAGWDIHQYDLRRNIPSYFDDDELAGAIAQHRRVYVLTSALRDPLPVGDWKLVVEKDLIGKKRTGDMLRLYAVTRRP